MKKQSLHEQFKNWPVRKKLNSCFGVVIVSTFTLIVLLLISLFITKTKVSGLYNGPMTSTFYAGDIRWGMVANQRAINRVIAVGDEVLSEEEANMKANIEKVVEAHDVLVTTLLSKENQILLDKIWDEIEQEEVYREELLDLLRTGEFEAANEYDEKYYTPLVNEIRENTELLDQSVFAVGEHYMRQAEVIAVFMLIVGVVLLVVITAVAVKLAFKVTADITEPIRQIENAASQLRIGDLSHGNDITYESEDELGGLAKSVRESINILDGYVKEICSIIEKVADGDLTRDFGKITDFLGDFSGIKKSFVIILKEFNNTLREIKRVSGQVDDGSDEVAAAANELASGTSEQASAVEELTATIETVSSMAERSANEAAMAYDMMMKSVEEAQEESRQMKNLQEEMARIKEISQEIELIVTSIEEIASQTSLLALNASIEAARAGEAGRGFAVVADQIGKLATDSAQAVITTKELIGKTVEEVDKGNEITGKTAAGFERVIGELEKFAQAAKANSEVSKTQSTALLQIEEGVNQIATVTQQNAAASEECSAISGELADRAGELDRLVDKFKLHG